MERFANLVRILLSFLVIFGMIFCFITKKELFPLAPYSMYSDRYSPSDLRILTIEFKNFDNLWVNADYEMIKPFDEARLKQALIHSYELGKESLEKEEIKQKVLEVLKLARKNTGVDYQQVRLRVVNYGNLNDLRDGKTNIIQERLIND